MLLGSFKPLGVVSSTILALAPSFFKYCRIVGASRIRHVFCVGRNISQSLVYLQGQLTAYGEFMVDKTWGIR